MGRCSKDEDDRYERWKMEEVLLVKMPQKGKLGLGLGLGLGPSFTVRARARVSL